MNKASLKIGKVLAGVSLVATLAGCSSPTIPERAPTPKDFKSTNATRLLIFSTNYPTTIVPPDLLVADEDHDGNVDVIVGEAGLAYWVAEGFITNFFGGEDARVITPEIQEAANTSLRASQNLAYLLVKDEYKRLTENLTF